ncbi:transmembrane protein 223-like [Dendronephthya gigantea]|uniref:transmembrane protein 223-like n=1 Tax=Dendronephthya gigantea TaxID=151771 RepID=UPI00106B24FB|nr:transmembrane protein 223-like [Dendronephthya gigantea]
MAGIIRNVLKNGHFSNICCRGILTRSTLQLFSSQRILTRPLATKYGQDIILYHYERYGFYKILAVASLSQLVFWSYMSYVMYVYIRPASQILQEHKRKNKTAESHDEFDGFKYFPKFLLDSKTQTVVSIASLGMGILFFFTGCLYALRSVNQLVLLRDGARIIVKTYTPVGSTKQFSVPLTDVSCLGSRLDEKAFVVFKIRDRRFYYMLDKRGEFMQPTIFDTTVGVKRWNL